MKNPPLAEQRDLLLAEAESPDLPAVAGDAHVAGDHQLGAFFSRQPAGHGDGVLMRFKTAEIEAGAKGECALR